MVHRLEQDTGTSDAGLELTEHPGVGTGVSVLMEKNNRSSVIVGITMICCITAVESCFSEHS